MSFCAAAGGLAMSPWDHITASELTLADLLRKRPGRLLNSSCLELLVPGRNCTPHGMFFYSRTRAERKDTQWPRTRFAYGTTKTLRQLRGSMPRPFPIAP